MTTLLFVFALIFSPIFPGIHPRTSSSDPCITHGSDHTFPQIIQSSDRAIECIQIDQVTATFSTTYPISVELNVAGKSWREMDENGYPIQIDQRRDGNDIFISIYRNIVPVNRATPADYVENISLDGHFETGSYTVHVNGYTVEIAIPNAPPPGVTEPPQTDQLIRSDVIVQDIELLSYPALYVTGTDPYGGSRCASPLQIEQRREGNTILIDIYRLIDPHRTCTAIRTSFNQTIQLNADLRPGRTYTIQVNNFVRQVTIPLPNPPLPDPVRSYAHIDHVEVLQSQQSFYLTLHVTGTYSQSCQGPLQIDQRREGNWVYVDIYQIVNPAIMCPERMAALDEYIPLDGTFDYGTYTIQVNDYLLTYSIPPGPIINDEPPINPDFQRVDAQIDHVEVITLETYPARLQIHVTGSQEGGCDMSYQIDQNRAGNQVYVEIYRLVNPLMSCDMRPTPVDEIIPLDGSFESGTVTIQVNNYVVSVRL